MTIYDIATVFVGVGAILTAIRYFTNKPKNWLLCFIQNFVGSFFIFSGYIKLIDPLGFSYKLLEYWTVFGESISPIFNSPLFTDTALIQSCGVTLLELVLGVALIMGWRVRITTLLILGMILFFTFLTFYTAYFNKVTDCGCFGDFMHLKPWETFGKDIILTIIIFPLFIFNKKITGLLKNNKWSWQSVLLATLVFGGLQYYCYAHLPVHDFRAYKPGTDICKDKVLPEGAKEDIYETKFYYINKKNAEVKEFSLSQVSIPMKDTATWKFMDRKDILIQEGDHPPIHDFVLTDDSGQDVTDSLLAIKGYKVFIITYDVAKSNSTNYNKINALYEACKAKQIPFYGLAGGAGVNEFMAKNSVQFPVLSCDGTQLKTMIRSNPGIILMKDCTVDRMWHENDIPSKIN